MRKVMTYKYILKGKRKYETVENGEAFFHGFGKDRSESRAIVEFPDGRVDMVSLEHIRFITPPDNDNVQPNNKPKHSNIIDALNAVLSEHFGAPCYFVDFYAEVPYSMFYGNEIQQGLFSAHIAFLSKMCFEADCLVSYATEGDAFKYNSVLLLGSSLRRKILEVMLEYN